jgi:transcriptional regulator with XRE-family HTH domain
MRHQDARKAMPRKRKRITEGELAIARRLKAIRQRRGLAQGDVAKAVGVKQPVLSECESGEIRLHGELLSKLATVLKVSTDEILGLKPADTAAPRSARLMQRLQRVEHLSPADRRSVLGIIDALLEKHGRNGHGSAETTPSTTTSKAPARATLSRR